MGIDTVEWPEDVEGARALFKRMPAQLAGMREERLEGVENLPGVEYRGGGDSALALASGTDNEIKDARIVLAAMFGLQFGCEKGTYAGTAPQMTEGGGQAGPGFTTGQADDRDERLWWFSCTVAGAEGDPKFTGHAVGWVSGDVGWLTVSSNERIAQSLIDALIRAR
ncbi:MAG: hypothetical protein M3312_06150 [Actinomycetota bacterium]|nr:hypothetical protein [Actinomycetota bacterium]